MVSPERHLRDAPGERRPLTLGLFQRGMASAGQPVVAATRTALAGPPRGLERAIRLEAMERRIERSLAQGECSPAPRADSTGNLVAVELAVAQRGEDEERQRSLEQLALDPPGIEHRSLTTSLSEVTLFPRRGRVKHIVRAPGRPPWSPPSN